MRIPPNVRALLGIAAPCIAALALRLSGLGSESFWADEYYTVSTAGASSAAGVFARALANDPHPPLYFLLIHFLAAAGWVSDFAVRLPSAIAGGVAVAAFGLFARRTVPAAALATWLFAVSPMHIWYSQEARPYALLVMFECIALWRLAAAFGGGEQGARGRALGEAAIALALGAWTHYFAAFPAVAAIAVAWGHRRQFSPAALAGAFGILAAASAAPAWWAAGRLISGAGIDWLPTAYGPALVVDALSAQMLGALYSPLPRGLALAGLAAGTILAAAGWRRLWRRRGEPAVALILAGAVACWALPIAISFVKPIVWHGQRYLVIAVPFTAALMAAGLEGARWRRLRLAAFLGLLACQGWYLQDYYRFRQKHTWDVAAAMAAELAGADADIAVMPSRNAGLLERYLPGGLHARGVDTMEELRPGGATVVVSYSDPRRMMADAGVSGPYSTRLLSTHRDGQDLWVVAAER